MLLFFISLLLAFGLPIHFIPSEIKQENFISDVYNVTLGNDWLHSKVFRKIEKWVGGSLWLFSHRVINKSYRNTPERTQLNVVGIVSQMTALEQLNQGVKKVERMLDNYPEIDFYETQISSNQKAETGRTDIDISDSAIGLFDNFFNKLFCKTIQSIIIITS